MTKRHASLIPLTHDHHHALAQARKLIASADAGSEERRDAAAIFVRFYEDDTLLHFHEEEEILFPKLLEHVEQPPPELIQVLVEHVRIHGMVARLREAVAAGSPEGDELRTLGETLRSHVRLEENKLFPILEEAVTDDELRRVSFAERPRLGSLGEAERMSLREQRTL